ncbi:MAG: flagellar hook-basal body complex protein FliE [Clostridia bacterium]|jgi:flagellar hook-basal body complex protein FliE|nr:flagellar hook-basal body complex protein FliE [Clostridia bacterium]
MKVSMLVPQPLGLFQVRGEKKEGAASFAQVLNEKLQEVNQLQKEADLLTNQFLVGEVEDLHQVMIAAEKANLALQMTVQIRNKLVEAYQEISRMQI